MQCKPNVTTALRRFKSQFIKSAANESFMLGLGSSTVSSVGSYEIASAAKLGWNRAKNPRNAKTFSGIAEPDGQLISDSFHSSKSKNLFRNFFNWKTNIGRFQIIHTLSFSLAQFSTNFPLSPLDTVSRRRSVLSQTCVVSCLFWKRRVWIFCCLSELP